MHPTPQFLFDEVFDEGSSNAEVYTETAAPLISRLFKNGQNSTCFAYGATGAGKTVRLPRARYARASSTMPGFGAGASKLA